MGGRKGKQAAYSCSSPDQNTYVRFEFTMLQNIVKKLNSLSIKATGGLYLGGSFLYSCIDFFTGRWAYNITGGGASKWKFMVCHLQI